MRSNRSGPARARFRYIIGVAFAVVVLWRVVGERFGDRADPARSGRSVVGAGAGTTSGASRAACDVPIPGTSFAAALAARQQREDALAKIHAFTDWVGDWRRTEAAIQPALVAQGRQLAESRRAALKYLIALDPKRALGSALPVTVRDELPAEVQPYLERRVDARGDLDVIIGCYGPEVRIDRWAQIYGQRYRTYVFGRREFQPSKQDVPLHGIAIDDVLALAEAPYRSLEPGEKSAFGLSVEAPIIKIGPEIVPLRNADQLVALRSALEQDAPLSSLIADSPPLHDLARLEALLRGPSAALAADWTVGTKRVLYLRVDFSDTPGSPATDDAISNSFSVTDQYFQDVSYGRCSMSLTVFPTVLRMPQPKTYYEADPDSYTQLSDEARKQARAYDAANGGTGKYNPDSYDRWIVLYPALKNHTYSGRGAVGATGLWLNGSLAAITHELGHNQGLQHSHAWKVTGTSPLDPAGEHVEYGDIFDVMGTGGAPGGYFNAPQKAALGYLDSSTITTVSQAGTYRVYRHDARDASGIQALKIPFGSDYDYWVEHRRAPPSGANLTGTQLATLQSGALIHWGKRPAFTPGPGVYLLDMNPDAKGDMRDATLAAGQTFTDPIAGINITPIGSGGTAPHEYIDVKVEYGATGSNHNPVLASLTAPGGTLQARTDLSFSASGSDPDGDSVFYRWDFGDTSSVTTTPTISHRWLKGGDYTITVSALDGKGGVATKTFPVKVDDPLLSWTRRAQGVTTRSLYDVIYATGKFVAVGDVGTVLLSSDGITWSPATAIATTPYYHGIAYGNGRFVGVGMQYLTDSWHFASGYSSDASTWSSGAVPTLAGQLYSVAFGAGRFVAVGDGGKIDVSTDGAAWQETSSSVTDNLYTIRFANGRFVAAGAKGRILTSTDGLAWTNVTPALASGYFNGITYYGGRWIVSAGYEVWTSTDALKWTSAPAAGTQGTRSAATALGLALSAGYDGKILFTEDASTWATISPSGDAKDQFMALAEGNGTVVAVGGGGLIYQAGSPALVSPKFHDPGTLGSLTAGRASALAVDASGFTRLELLVDGQVASSNSGSGALSFLPKTFGTYSLVLRGTAASGATISSAPVSVDVTLADWRWRSPLPIGQGLNDAVYIDDKWWVVGNSGLLATLDGAGNVAVQPSPVGGDFRAISYVDGRLIIAGFGYNTASKLGQSCMWSTTDRTIWSPWASGTYTYPYGLAYGGGQWLTVGYSGLVATSSDSVNWTTRTSGTTAALNRVTYSGNLWVAVGSAGTVITSPDGIKWTAGTSGTTNALNGVTFASGQFVAVGAGGTILTSPNGSAWSPATSGTTQTLNAVTFYQGNFIAVGESGTVRLSTDGATWRSGSVEGRSVSLTNLAVSGTKALLLGRNGEYFEPADPATWVSRTKGSTEAFRGVIYAGSRFVAISQGYDFVHARWTTPIATSTDGMNWTAWTPPAGSAIELYGISYGQQTYVAVGANGRILTSSDATAWISRTSGITANLLSVTSGPGLHVATAANGTILSSADGVTWTSRSSGSSTSLFASAYGQGTFVVVGDTGLIRTSPDGVTWTTRTSGTTDRLVSVAWLDGIGFLAGALNGALLQSSDGATWVARDAGGTGPVNAFCATPLGVVAGIGYGGLIAYSTDGVKWLRAPFTADRQVKGLAVSATALVAVGDFGEFLYHPLVVESVAPQIIAAPTAQSAGSGGAAAFSVTASGASSYQWSRNGTPIAGATGATLSLTNLQPSDDGAQFSVTVSNATGNITVGPVRLTIVSARLFNLSVRATTTSDDQALIVGFSVQGTGNKQVLLRAIGPTLTQFGVAGAVPDPRLKLYAGSALHDQNDDWGGSARLSSSFTPVGAFSLPPNSKDAALLVSLAPGSYSAQAQASSGSGIVLVEGYDADGGPSQAYFTNLSARNFVGVGDNILVVGFNISGTSPKKLLIRAVGPTLAQFGVGGVLVNPTLQLFNGSAALQSNDDWGGGQTLADTFKSVGAFDLPVTSKDSALLLTLQPGSYTVQVSGVNGSTGVALVEVYEVP